MRQRGPRQATAAAAALTTFVLLSAHAVAESYFCTPKPVKIGSYQPDDSSSEMDIRVSVPGAYGFWFDNENGDFIPHKDGVAGPVEHGRIQLPLLSQTYKDYATALVHFAFTAKQCVSAAMGVVPSTVKASQ